MSLFVNGFELFYRVVRIYLGGGQTAVPQYGLDGVEVRTLVEQMGGERMPDHMRAAIVNSGHHIQIFSYNSVNRFRVKRLSFNGDKDIIIFGSVGKFFFPRNRK